MFRINCASICGGLLLVGVSLSINGFLLRCPKSSIHHRHESQSSRSYALMFTTQTSTNNQDTDIFEGGPSNTIYPADTLMINVGGLGVNSTTQTLAPDIAYFYLQNTLALSEETMVSKYSELNQSDADCESNLYEYIHMNTSNVLFSQY